EANLPLPGGGGAKRKRPERARALAPLEPEAPRPLRSVIEPVAGDVARHPAGAKGDVAVVSGIEPGQVSAQTEPRHDRAGRFQLDSRDRGLGRVRDVQHAWADRRLDLQVRVVRTKGGEVEGGAA